MHTMLLVLVRVVRVLVLFSDTGASHTTQEEGADARSVLACPHAALVGRQVAGPAKAEPCCPLVHDDAPDRLAIGIAHETHQVPSGQVCDQGAVPSMHDQARAGGLRLGVVLVLDELREVCLNGVVHVMPASNGACLGNAGTGEVRGTCDVHHHASSMYSCQDILCILELQGSLVLVSVAELGFKQLQLAPISSSNRPGAAFEALLQQHTSHHAYKASSADDKDVCL
mmetsp:Transcript_36037/g.72536  ORF Transcript_36037/g.72536 Transcript_36037/m.72536 type:complete len:227 (+) Transcript_36037:698-1378(+)